MDNTQTSQAYAQDRSNLPLFGWGLSPACRCRCLTCPVRQTASSVSSLHPLSREPSMHDADFKEARRANMQAVSIRSQDGMVYSTRELPCPGGSSVLWSFRRHPACCGWCHTD